MNRKKYIWLTLVLVCAIFLAYMFYFSFKKPTIKKNSNINIVKKTNVIETWNTVESGNVEIKNENSVLTWNIENVITTSLDKANNKLVIWNIILNVVDDDTYDDIFDLLWYPDLPKYKIDGKKIYIKKINSIDYEAEKVNIKQLVQKIWGNIAEVNWFWDKQLFVNLEPYYKKISISLVEYDGSLYFMILPYDKYYEYEKTIKKFLFYK